MRDGADAIGPLRHRRLGGGYRREDVEAALESLLSTVRAVEADLRQLRQRSAQLERELDAARAEIGSYRARESELLSLLGRAEDLVARTEARTEAEGAVPAPEQEPV